MKNSKNQKGFVLLVAIGILMGLLSIITALVRFEQKNKNLSDEVIQDVAIDATIKTIKSTTYNKSSSLTANDKTKTVRSWMFPTMKNLPIRLSLRTSLNSGDTNVEVTDMRKLFFNLMSNRQISSSQPRQIKLAQYMPLDGTDRNTVIIEDEDGSNVLNIHEDIGGYILVGNELMVLESGGSGSYIVEERDTNGVGGVYSPHSVGEPVFVLHENNDELKGFLKINGLWFYAGVTEMYPDPQFTIYEYGTTNATTSSIDGSYRHSDGIDAGNVVEFYPFDMGFYDFDTTWNMNFSYTVVDEYSKMNINSFTETMAGNYLGATDYPMYMRALTDVNEYGLFPMKSVNELLIVADTFDNPTTLSKQSILDAYNLDKSNMTVFSKPNYYSHYDDEDPNLNNQTFFHFPSSLMNINLAGVQYRNTTSDYNEWADAADQTNLILPHSVNFNTASFSVMWRILCKIGPTSDEISDDKAMDLAGHIIRYRSGQSYNNSLSNEDFLEDINYNGYVNPFDGVNDDYGYDGDSDPNQATFYSSAENEFIDFMRVKGNLSNEQLKHLIAYVNKDVDALSDYGLNTKRTNFITFQSGEVETQRLKFSMSVGGEPAISLDEQIVSENFSYYNDYGDIIATDSGSDVGLGNIILDSIHGWNENQSIFYGVTFDQPFVDYVYNPAITAGNIIIEEHVDLFSTSTHSLSHIYPSLRGYYNNRNSYIQIDSLESYNTGNLERSFIGTTPGVADFYGTLDFGMRIKAENIFRTFTVDADGDAYWSTDGALPTPNATGCIMIDTTGILDVDDTNISFDFNEWSALMTNNSALVLRYNDNTFPIVEVNTTLNYLKVNPGTLNIDITNFLQNEKFTITTGPKSELYTFSGVGSGGPVAANQAFYETVIHRPSANFERISWIDNATLLTPNTTCFRVELKEMNGDVISTQSATNFIDLSSQLDPETDKFRVRFLFDDADATTGDYPTPQLFQVLVEYYMDDDQGPMNYVYNRK